jgi:hypothetical protein
MFASFIGGVERFGAARFKKVMSNMVERKG